MGESSGFASQAASALLLSLTIWGAIDWLALRETSFVGLGVTGGSAGSGSPGPVELESSTEGAGVAPEHFDGIWQSFESLLPSKRSHPGSGSSCVAIFLETSQ